jgi:branched-chain amino acid transport system permease protein
MQGQPPKVRSPWLTTLLDNWLLLAVLAFLLIFPHLVGWLTDSSPFGVERGNRFIMQGRSVFWQSVFIEIYALAILVMSYNLMFGFTGVISFGHALFFGLGGYIVGMMWQYTDIAPNLGLGMSIILTMGITGALGLFIGLVSLRLRGIYFAIFTLAVAEMVWIYVGRWPLTNGEDGFTISRMPEWLDPSRTRINLYYIALALFVFTFLFIRRLVNSPTGTVFQAIRENEERAKTIGYHTLTYKLIAITIASMMAGGAGILHALLNKKLGPEMFSVVYTVDALLMTIIGGVGTFIGPVIGAGSLHIADVLFRDADTSILGFNIGQNWLLITGFIFVIVVLVFPYGMVGTWRRAQSWLTRRWRSRSEKVTMTRTGKPVEDSQT